jgi:hypothetical protein
MLLLLIGAFFLFTQCGTFYPLPSPHHLGDTCAVSVDDGMKRKMGDMDAYYND